jgi:hypothetical protein
MIFVRKGLSPLKAITFVLIIIIKVDPKACSDHKNLHKLSSHLLPAKSQLVGLLGVTSFVQNVRANYFRSAIFSSILNTCSSFRMTRLLTSSRKVWPATFLINFISAVSLLLLSDLLSAQFSLRLTEKEQPLLGKVLIVCHSWFR